MMVLLIYWLMKATDTQLSVAFIYDAFTSNKATLLRFIMIILHQTNIEFSGINASPFCQKLHSFLKQHKLLHQVQTALPHHGPYNKMPYVTYQGSPLADSECIIEQLAKDFEINIHLTPTARSWQRTLEEHLYWIMVYSRWMDNDAWKILKRAFFNPVPILFRHWVSSKARTLVRRNLYSQGLGRLSEQQIYQKGETDLKALNAHLTQSKFIGGEVLCHADFFARALLRNINNTEMPTRLTKIADKYQALSAYCLRVEKVLS